MGAQEIKVGVVGAGNMGGGIAQKLAMEGFPVILCDLGQAQLDRGMDRIRAILDEGVQRRAVAPALREATLSRLEATADLGRLAECQLVIEAVFEDLQVKRDLFARLEAIVPATDGPGHKHLLIPRPGHRPRAGPPRTHGGAALLLPSREEPPRGGHPGRRPPIRPS